MNAMTRIVCWSLFVLLNAPLTAAASPDARAGVAALDITPPLGVPLAGYYHARGADGVLDPLYSRALVIEAGGTRVALVALDLINVTRTITEEARAAIEQDAGIPPHQVLIGATHAHTGPQLARRSRRTDVLGGQHPITVEYSRALPSKVAETVRLAAERLEPARLQVARGQCEGLTFNRRYFMRDGSVGWNPGKRNPNIVLPAGPADAELGVFYIEQAGARGPAQGLATYVNFAMHTDTTGGSRISADWPGALARTLAGYHGPQHQTLTGLGACGNLNHLDFDWAWPQSSAAEQHRIGTLLAAAVLQTYKELQPLEDATPRAAFEHVSLDLPEISPGEVEEARKLLEATRDDRGGNFMQLVRAYRALDVADRQGRPLEAEVQVIALGSDIAWVALPGEVFVELGLAIKKRSPFPNTHIVTLANDNLGYIPDRRSYAEGNYEPESARCAPGSGEKLVEAAVRLLTRLHTRP